MNIEQDLYLYLTTDPGISALAGSRVYPVKLKEGATLPAVTYQRVSTARTYAHAAASGLAHPLFQITAWGKQYEEARALADAIIAALNGYRGGMGQSSALASFLDSEVALYDPDAMAFQVALTVSIWHHE